MSTNHIKTIYQKVLTTDTIETLDEKLNAEIARINQGEVQYGVFRMEHFMKNGRLSHRIATLKETGRTKRVLTDQEVIDRLERHGVADL